MPLGTVTTHLFSCFCLLFATSQAHALISVNSGRLKADQRMLSNRQEGSKILHLFGTTAHEEMGAVVAEVRRLWKGGGQGCQPPLSSFCVLARTRRIVNTAKQFFRQHGLPVYRQSRHQIFRQVMKTPQVQDMIAYFDLVTAAGKSRSRVNEALLRVRTTSCRGRWILCLSQTVKNACVVLCERACAGEICVSSLHVPVCCTLPQFVSCASSQSCARYISRDTEQVYNRPKCGVTAAAVRALSVAAQQAATSQNGSLGGIPTMLQMLEKFVTSTQPAASRPPAVTYSLPELRKLYDRVTTLQKALSSVTCAGRSVWCLALSLQIADASWSAGAVRTFW